MNGGAGDTADDMTTHDTAADDRTTGRTTDPTVTDPTLTDLERRLDELEAESKQRRAELRAIAASLPEATSRRALFRALASDLRNAPDRGLVAKRVVLKMLRLPSDLVRRARRR